MPSPFPGMDPYLEGYMWADVHHALASQFRKQLVPLVQPHYAVRIEVTIYNDRVPAHELGIMYPDVEIIQSRPPADRLIRETAGSVTIAPAQLSMPLTIATQVRQASVQIRDIANNRLVTLIEIISPSNKREPGQTAYLAKRDELRIVEVHLLEIDLLRRGTRPWPEEHVPDAPYLATLIRARHIRAEVWTIDLRERLPVLPVPLRQPDADVPLDVQAALDTIYDEAAYPLTLDYSQPPPEPPLSEADATWAAECIQRWREQ
jgi:Protein of unknown function (DUF4058)